MGLKTKGIPDPMDRFSGDGSFVGEGANRPVGGIFGLGIQGFTDNCGDQFVCYGAGATVPQFIMEPRDSLFEVTLAPFANRLVASVVLQ